MSQKCNTCDIKQDFSEFFKDKSKKSGYRGQCKKCDKKTEKKRATIPKDYTTVVMLNCSKCGMEKESTEFYKQQSKTRGYESKCKKCVMVKNKNYIKNNKEKANLAKNTRARNRYHNDISFRTMTKLRNRFKSTVKNNRFTNTLELLECDLPTFIKWIQFQFVDGMTWDNYEEWHYDHCLPVNLFDLTKLEEQQMCFHWSNIQPLWAKDNLRKNNKIDINQITNQFNKVRKFLDSLEMERNVQRLV